MCAFSQRPLHYPPFQPPLLQPLLCRQSMILVWLCGLYACRYPLPALSILLLLFWIDSRLRAPQTLFCSACIFLLGYCAIYLTMPVAPERLPDWAQDAKHMPRLSALIDEVRPMPGNRLRILLSDIRPEAPTTQDILSGTPRTTQPDTTLHGKASWTWDEASVRPLAGQRVTFSLRLRSLGGFHNIDATHSQDWWHSRQVFYRFWSRGAYGDPQFYGEGNISARVREKIRQQAITLLRNNSVFSLTPQNIENTSSDSPPLPAAILPVPSSSLASGKEILPALLFSDRSFISAQTMEQVRIASLAHSIALSGQHLAVIFLFAGAGVWLVAYILPSLYLYQPRRFYIICATLPLALLYLWLGDAPASLIRATGMLFLAALAFYRIRPANTLDVLLCTVFLITLFSPPAIFDIGLQLSALAVATIGMALPLLRRLTRFVQSLFPKYPRVGNAIALFCGILAISTLLQIALLPLSIVVFHQASLWFPLNMLWLPLLGIWVLPLALFALIPMLLGLSTVAAILFDLAALPCQWLLATLHFLDTHNLLFSPPVLHPHWTTALGLILLGIAAFAQTGRPHLPQASRKLLLLGTLLLFTGPVLRQVPYWDASTSLQLLDVGQGQAIILNLPYGKRLVIDAGNARAPFFDAGRSIVEPALSANRPPRLDALILTHPDQDHTGGAWQLASRLRPTTIYSNGEEPTSPAKKLAWKNLQQSFPVQTLRRGERIICTPSVHIVQPPFAQSPDSFIDVLHPANDSNLSGNNASLVLRVVHRNKGLALLTGDIEKGAITQLRHNTTLQADVLVAPHHGSRSSFSKAFYDAVAPQYILVSYGRDTRFAYPHKEVRTYSHEKNIPLLGTGASGEIRIRWHQQHTRMSVQTARPQKQ